MTPGKVLKRIAISKALLETLRTLSNPERHIPLDILDYAHGWEAHAHGQIINVNVC